MHGGLWSGWLWLTRQRLVKWGSPLPKPPRRRSCHIDVYCLWLFSYAQLRGEIEKIFTRNFDHGPIARNQVWLISMKFMHEVLWNGQRRTNHWRNHWSRPSPKTPATMKYTHEDAWNGQCRATMRPVTDEVQLQRLQSYAASLLDTWAARACLCARTAPFKKMLGRCIEENVTHSCIMKTLVSFQAQTECGGMTVSSPWTKLGIYAFMGKCSASSLPLMTAPRTAAHSLQDSLDSLSALWAHCCANKKLAEVCALYRLYDHVSLAASCLHLTWAHTVKAGWLWAWPFTLFGDNPQTGKF